MNIDKISLDYLNCTEAMKRLEARMEALKEILLPRLKDSETLLPISLKKVSRKQKDCPSVVALRNQIRQEMDILEDDNIEALYEYDRQISLLENKKALLLTNPKIEELKTRLSEEEGKEQSKVTSYYIKVKKEKPTWYNEPIQEFYFEACNEAKPGDVESFIEKTMVKGSYLGIGEDSMPIYIRDQWKTYKK